MFVRAREQKVKGIRFQSRSIVLPMSDNGRFHHVSFAAAIELFQGDSCIDFDSTFVLSDLVLYSAVYMLRRKQSFASRNNLTAVYGHVFLTA